ncbi:MAG: FAD-dependent oxidoreductase [Pseudomonadota bacterium]
MTTHQVAQLADLPENQMVDVQASGRDLVLVRRGDVVHALDGKCPHKGVPMSKGAIVGDQLVCGIHRAAFALQTGELQAPPACEALQRYDVSIEGGDVIVSVPDDKPVWPVPPMASKRDDDRHFVVVGAGAAGWRAAETLRMEGFEGRITVVGDEAGAPYDRTDLSKAYLGAADNPSVTTLRDMAVARKHDIELLHGTATAVDHLDQQISVTTPDGQHQQLHYDSLLVATGSSARSLPLDGADLKGVHTLRSEADAKALRADLDAVISAKGAANVAIIGAGFIGLEAAVGFSKRDNVEATIVAREALPMAGLFGDAFGERLLAEHRDAGVNVLVNTETKGFTGAGRVTGVELGNGETLAADLVLVAIGAAPNTDWLPFDRDRDGGIAVTENLNVSGHDNIFIAGDIARLPTPWGNVRIEHWRCAQETGELAARNMLGASDAYDSTPFFWTMQHIGGSYTLTGHNSPDDVVEGDVAPADFTARYIADGKVTAVLAHGLGEDLTGLERKMAGKGPLSAGDVTLG